jgi:polyphosphate:AMP phosphotransferase
MLKSIDVNRELSKEEFKSQYDTLARKIGELQRDARLKNRPILIIFEGVEGAGKGTLINNLLIPMDSRGISVEQTLEPNEEERFRPFFWRFWNKIPSKGRITIFDRSYYNRIVDNRFSKKTSKEEIDRYIEEIESFEKQLAIDGTIIFKFFLHITQKDQKKRFEKLEKNNATRWRVSKDDWHRHKKYDKLVSLYDNLLGNTNFSFAPWTVIESTDERFATHKLMTSLINTLQIELSVDDSSTKQQDIQIQKKQNPLDSVNLALALEKDEYKEKLKKLQSRIHDIEHEIYVHRIPLVIMYEGWDAAGKGGNIRRLVEEMDPRGYEVVSIAAPNEVERGFHYLWRFWTRFPKGGHITIFDRSWYGRVLVERIEGFARDYEWKRAFNEINEMEKQLTDYGTVLVKFWLEISKDEQLRRFKEREQIPYKQWKITDEDYRNREKWDQYREAVGDMIALTSTENAPWTIIESNSKYFARIKALETVIEAAEKALKKK